MQFKVPRNIDLEDKIVGPLTLVQFLYLLGGALIDYMMFQSFGTKNMGIFLVFGIPIALVALALAFLKIQEQPLSHFFSVGLLYLTKPKVRLWKRQGEMTPVFTEPPKPKNPIIAAPPRKHLDKSALEDLAYQLDTNPLSAEEKKNFGSVSQNFSKLLIDNNVNIPKNMPPVEDSK